MKMRFICWVISLMWRGGEHQSGLDACYSYTLCKYSTQGPTTAYNSSVTLATWSYTSGDSSKCSTRVKASRASAPASGEPSWRSFFVDFTLLCDVRHVTVCHHRSDASALAHSQSLTAPHYSKKRPCHVGRWDSSIQCALAKYSRIVIKFCAKWDMVRTLPCGCAAI